MKFRTIILSGVLLATASGFALAQYTTTPADQNSPGMQGTGSSKPHDNMGMKRSHSNGSMAPATTGAGTHPMKDTSKKNMAPASPNTGEGPMK